MLTPAEVERARAETIGLRGGRVHFNSCGASLMPRRVADAVRRHVDRAEENGGYEAEAEAAPALDLVYRAIAELIGCDRDRAPGYDPRDEIAVVENATRAWDLAFYALPFEDGDMILTSGVEYASNLIPFHQTHAREGSAVEIVHVDSDGDGRLSVDHLSSLLAKHTDRVKLIAVTHVPTNGGLVNPAEEIGRLAREHRVSFLLDACQSVGQMPVDVRRWNVDMLSATSRKFLRGPRGVGFLYVRQGFLGGYQMRGRELEPPFLDLHAAEWQLQPEAPPAGRPYKVRPGARRFENWESNVAGKLGLGEAVRYALGWGVDRTYARIQSLADLLRNALRATERVHLRDLGPEGEQCGIVSFTPGPATGCSPRDLVRRLAVRDVCVTLSRATSTPVDMQQRGLLDGVVRAGVHYYNTEEEVERFARQVNAVLG